MTSSSLSLPSGRSRFSTSVEQTRVADHLAQGRANFRTARHLSPQAPFILPAVESAFGRYQKAQIGRCHQAQKLVISGLAGITVKAAAVAVPVWLIKDYVRDPIKLAGLGLSNLCEALCSVGRVATHLLPEKVNIIRSLISVEAPSKGAVIGVSVAAGVIAFDILAARCGRGAPICSRIPSATWAVTSKVTSLIGNVSKQTGEWTVRHYDGIEEAQGQLSRGAHNEIVSEITKFLDSIHDYIRVKHVECKEFPEEMMTLRRKVQAFKDTLPLLEQRALERSVGIFEFKSVTRDLRRTMDLIIHEPIKMRLPKGEKDHDYNAKCLQMLASQKKLPLDSFVPEKVRKELARAEGKVPVKSDKWKAIARSIGTGALSGAAAGIGSCAAAVGALSIPSSSRAFLWEKVGQCLDESTFAACAPVGGLGVLSTAAGVYWGVKTGRSVYQLHLDKEANTAQEKADHLLNAYDELLVIYGGIAWALENQLEKAQTSETDLNKLKADVKPIQTKLLPKLVQEIAALPLDNKEIIYQRLSDILIKIADSQPIPTKTVNNSTLTR